MNDNKNVKARPVVTEHTSSLKHSNSNQDVYSETLITSDIGKVYFALAEAIGRLKS